MTIRGYGLAGLGIACVAGALLAQSPPRPDNLPSPGLATPNFSQAVLKPPNVQLKVPPGFSVSIYAEKVYRVSVGCSGRQTVIFLFRNTGAAP